MVGSKPRAYEICSCDDWKYWIAQGLADDEYSAPQVLVISSRRQWSAHEEEANEHSYETRAAQV
jgi:hypothetical protein